MWEAIQDAFGIRLSDYGSFGEALQATFEIRLSDFGFATNLSVCDLLLSLWLGLCIAIVAVSVIRGQRRTVILALLRHKAVGEENAKTVASLRLSNGFPNAFTLRRSGGEFAKTVRVAGEVLPTYDEYVTAMHGNREQRAKANAKIDVSAAKFYISREYLDRAKRSVEQKAPTVLGCVCSILCVSAVFAVVIALLPEILTLLAGLAG